MTQCVSPPKLHDTHEVALYDSVRLAAFPEAMTHIRHM